MKIFVFTCLLLSLAAVALCYDDDNYDKARWKCQREVNISEAELNSFFAGVKPADPSQNLMCFMRCILDKRDIYEHGMFMENSAINFLKRIPSLMPFPSIDQRLAQCKNMRGATECETAYKITVCLMGI